MTTPTPSLPPLVPLDVCNLFEKLTLDLWNLGFQHYSARAILHQIRWHNHVMLNNRSFKCNNNWTPALARWFMLKHPYTNDFFKIRSSPAAPVFNPDHSLDDYMGPF
jgi:hypothetical protein